MQMKMDLEEKKMFCNHLLKKAREANEQERSWKSGLKTSGFLLEERSALMHEDWMKLPKKNDFDFFQMDQEENEKYLDVKGCRSGAYSGNIFLEVIQNKKTGSKASYFKKENIGKKIVLVFVDFESGVEYWIHDLHRFAEQCIGEMPLKNGGYQALGVTFDPKDFPEEISVVIPWGKVPMKNGGDMKSCEEADISFARNATP